MKGQIAEVLGVPSFGLREVKIRKDSRVRLLEETSLVRHDKIESEMNKSNRNSRFSVEKSYMKVDPRG